MRTRWIQWTLVVVFAFLSTGLLAACDTRDKTKMPEVNPQAEAERHEAPTADGGGVPIPD